MTTKVLFWRRSEISFWGHVAIQLSDGTYISWWPQMTDRILKYLFGILIGTFPGSTGESYNSDMYEEGGAFPNTYDLGKLDEYKMREFWREFTTFGDQKWNIFSQNCATVAHAVLREGHEFFKSKNAMVWTPSSLENIVREFTRIETNENEVK